MELKKSLAVICFSVIFSFTQICSADTAIGSGSSGGNSSWVGAAIGGAAIIGGGIALALALKKGNSDDAQGSAAGPGLPVIHSSSNYNLLSVNGSTATGTITVLNNNDAPGTFKHTVDNNNLVVDSNSSKASEC